MGGKLRGAGRFSRHLYDLAQLDSAGYSEAALVRKDIAHRVVGHKTVFFPEKAEIGGIVIDYGLAVSGQLKLVPEGTRLSALAKDYDQMLEDGLLLDDSTSFDEILDRCRSLQATVNTALTAR